MITTDWQRRTGTGRAVRREQGGGIDFERRRRIGRHIGRRAEAVDAASPAEQQPANLARRVRPGQGDQFVDQSGCYFDAHRHFDK